MLDPPPLKSDNHFFGNYTIFSALMEKKCIILFENPKQISKNWCWTCKISGTLLKMLVIPCKMMATPCKTFYVGPE